MKLFFCLFFISILVGCDLPIKTDEPVRVVAPVSKPTGVDPRDSTYLRIRLVTNGYEISFFEKSFVTRQVEAIDSFIYINKDRINKNKVLVSGNDSTDDFKPLIPIFNKYGISKFYTQ